MIKPAPITNIRIGFTRDVETTEFSGLTFLKNPRRRKATPAPTVGIPSRIIPIPAMHPNPVQLDLYKMKTNIGINVRMAPKMKYVLFSIFIFAFPEYGFS